MLATSLLVTAAVLVPNAAAAPERRPLLQDEEGQVVLFADPQPEDFLAGGCFLLTSPDGDVFFAEDRKVLELEDVPRVTVDGHEVLALFVVEGRRAVSFPADGIHVRAKPPGYELLDADGNVVPLGLSLPLVIEQPLPPSEEEPEDDADADDDDDAAGDDAVEDAAAGSAGLGKGLGGLLGSLTNTTKRRLLEDPETANELLLGLLGDGGGGFLDALGIEIKVIDLDDGESTLGIAYDYAESLVSQPSEETTKYETWELELVARGTIAFEEDVNPENLLETRLVYKYARSTGGVREDAGPPTKEEAERRLQRVQALADLGEDFKQSEEFREHSKEVRSLMTPQLYFDVGLSATLESDQDLGAKNFAYGVQALVDYKVWDPGDRRAKLNVLDLPFAALRRLTGYDDEWQVRGSAFPTFLLALEQVEPDGDTPRDAVDDGDSYPRLRGEASFRTPVAWLDDSQTFFNANYRVYSEISPSGAVKDAGFDDFDYVELSLTTDSGFLLSYTSGMLPFDVDEGSSLHAGWQFHL